MKRFSKFIIEFIALQDRVLKNPSKETVAAQRRKSRYGELRYLMHRETGDVWTGDAGGITHDGLAKEAGMFDKGFDPKWTAKSSIGIIHNWQIKHIRQHPHGLRGWIRDRHGLK